MTMIKVDPSEIEFTNTSKILAAMGQVESGGDYSRQESGGGPSSGKYQFMPETWREWSAEYQSANDLPPGRLPRTPENQEKVATFKVQQLQAQGHTPEQIASIWNSGSPKWEGKVGINKYGKKYDVPGHVAKFQAVFNALGPSEAIAAKIPEQPKPVIHQWTPQVHTYEWPEATGEVSTSQEPNYEPVSPEEIDFAEPQQEKLDAGSELPPVTIPDDTQPQPGPVASIAPDEVQTAVPPITQVQPSLIAGVGQSAVNYGAIAASVLNKSLADFSKVLDDAAKVISDKTGLPKGDVFNQASQELNNNANYWANKIKDPAWIEEVVGGAVGGAVPGVAEFAMSVPYAALKGYTQGGVKGAVQEGFKRVLLGNILHGANMLKLPSRTAALGAVGAAQAGAEGASPSEMGKTAGTMALMAPMGPRGGISAKEAIKPAIEIAKGIPQNLPGPLASEAGAVRVPGTGPVMQIWDDILRGVAPTMRGSEAKWAGRKISEGESRMARRMDQFMYAMKDAEKNVFGKMTRDEALDFMQAMDTGQPQATPRLQDLANVIDSVFANRVDLIRSLGTGKLETVRDNYFPHIWKKGTQPPNIEAMISQRRNFQGSKAFMKQRVWDDVMTGIDAGAEPVSWNPLDLVAIKLHEMDKYYLAQKFYQDAKAEGLTKAHKFGTPMPDGYSDIEDHSARIWRPVKDAQDRVHFVDYGRWVATDQVAQVLNNYLSPTLYQNKYIGKLFSHYMGAGNTLNMFQLGLGSLFHGGFTSLEAVNSQVALGLKSIVEGRPKDALNHLGTAPVAMVKMSALGDKIINEWRLPGTQSPIISQVVEGIHLGGGQFGMEKGLRSSHVKKMWEDWHKDLSGKIKAGIRSPFALAEASMIPILNWYVPRLKGGVFGAMYLDFLKQNPNATALETAKQARWIWNRVDGMLGQVVYNRTFVHNYVKNAAQALMRAPGWKGGTLVEFGGALKDTVNTVLHPSEAEITSRMYWVVANGMVTATMNGILTKLFTGDDPEGMDFLAFRTSKKDKYGNYVRFMSPTYVKDLYAYANKGLIEPILAATNPILNMMIELKRNRDYYGVEIWHPADRWYEEVPRKLGEIATHVGKQFEPFWTRGERKVAESGHVTPEERVLPLAGFMPAPARYSMSDAQELAHELVGTHFGEKTRTKEQRDRSDLANQWKLKAMNDPNLQKEIEAMDGPQIEEMKALVRDKKLTRDAYHTILKSPKVDDLQATVKRLTADEVARVWNRSTPEEQSRITDIFKKKIWGSKSLTPEQKKEMQQKFFGENPGPQSAISTERKITRRGMDKTNGRQVVQYDDGTLEYAA